MKVGVVYKVLCVLAFPAASDLISYSPLTFSTCFSCTFFLEHSKHAPASGPLHMQLAVPGTLFPRMSTRLTPLEPLVLYLNVVLSEKRPKLASQNHHLLLPTSIIFCPFSYLNNLYLYPLSEKCSYLFIHFWPSISPEFKFHE